MAACASAVVFLLLLRAALAARVQTDLDGGGECGREVATPKDSVSLRQYFDAARVSSGILSSTDDSSSDLVDPAQCTKKDVCLLMRQLDMDFYARARQGLLTDSDYDTPPTRSWHTSGNCKNSNRAYPEVPVTDADTCREEARKHGADGELQEVRKSTLPSGCSVETFAGKTKVYLNQLNTDVTGGITYEGKERLPKTVAQLCAMDRSLSEAAAAYYSPYKLKPSMEGREAASTSCSFGMMAYLSQLRETMSPCAKILTYRPDSRFHSADHALQVAQQLEKADKADGAAKVRQYVETMRQKYVLMDTIANHWCPDTWTTAKATEGASCDALRVMAWTEEGKKLKEFKAKQGNAKKGGGKKGGRQPADGGRMNGAGNAGLLAGLDALLAELAAEDTIAMGLKSQDDLGGTDSSGKPVKISLNDASCDAFEDETLASRLEDAPAAPPDFFTEKE
uniref:Uncharacterized protein n=1 Tax=Alexandrium monilatum TaxID=311494 RepID=A0A7S4R6B4_9DINO|mmetsp:Transcript_46774/g.139636  ORF Transcript_46774/g.139636 Transcript_46774/m.139636 type:complete len:452 (-) Transcript_46774:49-1404(-)|eukprot:CAMPEP_0175227794 /NCGR_PEP_ID=MMETSP0093-20121207/23588_1 /TAXON_ID=311494 /ORGANISM="Alexandrium monilatum, Strain CCMP3105" /LENGTH=451 /DNA_ID=CAMNT_0016521553 /DNA_START=60 /DNA_END=1415 /DNA_ORIENTATION=+